MGSEPWFSTMSAGDVALLRETGLEPVGGVMANAAMLPLLVGLPAVTMEVSASSKLATEGWEKTLVRLKDAAKELGADGVSGISLKRRTVTMPNGDATEFSAMGTAVRGLKQRDIWTSKASVAELALLARSGFRPVSLVVGCCTWYQSAYPWVRTLGHGPLGFNVWINEELPFATEAAYTAREIAMERMQREAQLAGASGILAVDLHQSEFRFLGYQAGAAVGFEATGTAVVAYSTANVSDFTVAVPISVSAKIG